MASLQDGFEEPGDVQDIRLVVDTIPTLAWFARPDGSAGFILTSPVSQDFTFSPVSVPLSEAAVDTEEPLAHIRQNFEIDNLWLGDFEVRPAPVSP